MENVRKLHSWLLIGTNSLFDASDSLTFKIPIDLLLWKTDPFLFFCLGLQVEGLHLQWVFERKNVIIVFLKTNNIKHC
jgi:hypothetical protein